jgi:hypothetical protein
MNQSLIDRHRPRIAESKKSMDEVRDRHDRDRQVESVGSALTKSDSYVDDNLSSLAAILAEHGINWTPSKRG